MGCTLIMTLTFEALQTRRLDDGTQERRGACCKARGASNKYCSEACNATKKKGGHADGMKQSTLPRASPTHLVFFFLRPYSRVPSGGPADEIRIYADAQPPSRPRLVFSVRDVLTQFL